MTDLTALIAKLEAAAEGSPELDAAIAEALALYPADHIKALHGGNYWSRSGDPYDGMWHPPTWTRSIDAALTLVPDRTKVGLYRDEYSGRWSAVIGDKTFQGRFSHNGAPTAPLALMVAILRMRAAS